MSGGNTSVRDGDVVRITQTGAELGKLTPEKHRHARPCACAPGRIGAVEGNGHASGDVLGEKYAQAVVHASDPCDCLFDADQRGVLSNAVPPYTAAFYVRAGRVSMIKYHPSGAHSLHEAVAALAPGLPCDPPAPARRHCRRRRHVGGNRCRGGGGAVLPDCRCDRFSGASLTDDQLQAIDDALGRTWK